MPARHDWVCTACGHVERDLVLPLTAPGQEPDCPKCGDWMEILWTGRSASVDAIEPIEFEHDSGEKETVRTLSRAREIERQAEAATAAGHGRPIVFRHLSQDSSNRDVNVFQSLHPQVARERLLRTRRGRRIISVGGVDIRVHGDPNEPGGEE